MDVSAEISRGPFAAVRVVVVVMEIKLLSLKWQELWGAKRERSSK